MSERKPVEYTAEEREAAEADARMMEALRGFNDRNGPVKSPLEGLGTPVPALIYWSTGGRMWGVKQALLAGADVDERMPEDAKITAGYTALIAAAGQGHLEIVRLLVEQGADVNLREVGGWTALDAATEGGHHDVAAFLRSVERDGSPGPTGDGR